MPSSITLTVAHLPTSTSFFLSALQPLQYVYRGKVGDTVGFGPRDTTTPPDFWLTQEIPGLPAGAAHVAFPANSHRAVQDFFITALKAGGKIHGEPAVRDASGYYSAAVIDFDGNSIEAVFRPSHSDDKENLSEVGTAYSSKTKATTQVSSAISRNIDTNSQIGRSTAPTRKSSEGVVDTILNEARGTANVARDLVNQFRANISTSPPSAPTTSQTTNTASDAIIGTLFGVAAGAALHYAFTSSNNSASPDSNPRPSFAGRSTTAPAAYIEPPRALEAPPSSFSTSRYAPSAPAQRQIAMYDKDQPEYASTTRPASRRRNSISSTTVSRQTPVRLLEAPPTSFRAPTALTVAESSASSRRSRSRSRSLAPTLTRSASQSSRHTRSSNHTAIRMGESEEIGIIQRTSAHPSRAPSVVESVHSKVSQILSRVPSAAASRNTKAPRYPSTAPSVAESKHSKISHAPSRREPREYPLPPSRAATWDGSEAGSFMTAKSQKTNKTITPRSFNKPAASAVASERAMTKSVVSKVKDVERLDVSHEELAPSDSVSQISNSGSRRSRASRR